MKREIGIAIGLNLAIADGAFRVPCLQLISGRGLELKSKYSISIDRSLHPFASFDSLGETSSTSLYSNAPAKKEKLQQELQRELQNEIYHGLQQQKECPILEGTSAKAIRLRKQLQQIWTSDDADAGDTKPIILTGPKGSGKTQLAEEIVRRLPSLQTRSVHRLSLEDGVDFINTLLGVSNTTLNPGVLPHPGLLDDLAPQSNSTLILRGFSTHHIESKENYDRREELSRSLASIVMEGRYFSSFRGEWIPFLPRLIICTSRDVDYFKSKLNEMNRLDQTEGANSDVGGLDPNELNAIIIKVPSLESRKSDIQQIASSKLNQLTQFAPKLGLANVTLSQEALNRLLDHKWETGEDELEMELYLGLKRLSNEKKWNPFLIASKNSNDVLKSKHLLVSANDEKMRRRLLYDFPMLRDAIHSPWVFGKTLNYVVIPAFAAILAVLFWGPQSREENVALTIFWAGWWPGIMLVFPLLGRIWCTICPFMAVGNLAQEITTSLGIELKKWPQWSHKSNFGPAFAFFLFYAILMWEELWDLPQNANLSACLLLLITSGAVVNSVIYEKRLWCRYLCPIGAMNKMFATNSMVEVRTFKSNCEGCTNPTCIDGGSQTLNAEDKYALKGCTMDLKNNQLRDMGDCVMCMSCVKNCEREAPELNVRPIGQDYGLPWMLPKKLQPDNLPHSQVETNFWLGGIITILQGSVILHYLPKILMDVGIDPTLATVGPSLDSAFALHAMLSAMILALPGTFSYFADQGSVALESFVNVLKREFTTRPAENAAIINLYESMIKQNVDVAKVMKDWDLDGDGVVSDWEMKEAFKRLEVPEYEHSLLLDLLGKEKHRSTASLMDSIQKLYFDVETVKKTSQVTLRSIAKENELVTSKTFVEIFNALDKNGNGFLTKDEFAAMATLGYFKKQLTQQELNDMFDRADILCSGKLNLFEFMSIMRKTVKVGIQEIGYGYLPLAWGSLTSYWLGLAMRELGLSLTRVPDTFYVWFSPALKAQIPQFVSSWDVIHSVQLGVMIASSVASLALTQKLCDDNKIGIVRYGMHAAVQAIGTALTLYLMLSPELSISSYR